MTKLDLSALKKQKSASEATPAVVAIPSVATAETAPVSTPMVTVSAAAVPEKTADAPLKPKLSLSSFKKPGSATSTAPLTTPVAAEPTASVISTEPEPASASVVMEMAETVVTAEPAIQAPEPAAVVADVETTVSVVAAEPVAETVIETAVEAETAPSDLEAESTTPSSSEFFPNLALENDNLFSDIVGMGSFEEEKEGPIVEMVEPAVVMEQAPETVSGTEAVASEVASEEAATILESIDAPSFEEMMTSEGPSANAETVSSETAAAVEPMAKTEYVESVAKELSKERKGGLSELFDKKRKVLFGVTALVVASVGVVGSLYGFGVLEGSKANVTESKTVEVAMVKKPAPKPPVNTPSEAKPKDGAMAELPPPIVPNKVTATGSTASGVTVVVTPVSAHTGSVVTQLPATSSGTAVASASGATIAPVAPVNSNVNTLRTPNVRKKRSE